MLWSMYGASFDDSAGCTRNRCTNAGYDLAGQQGDERPQADGDHRQHPAPPPDVDDEQAEREQRDQHQQVDRRQLHVDVGVRGAVDGASVENVSS